MLTLTKIQSELKAPKNLTNKFGGYSYRSCEGILEAAKPILAKYEAAVIISDKMVAVGLYDPCDAGHRVEHAGSTCAISGVANLLWHRASPAVLNNRCPLFPAACRFHQERRDRQ